MAEEYKGRESRPGRSSGDRPSTPRRGDSKKEGPTGRAVRSEGDRPEWQRRVARERTGEKSPLIPSEITPEDLEFGVRVQLKTLTPENAEMVARHLAMVSLLIDDDPELAHRHAKAAAQRAGRLALVHETLGITAYAVGDYTLALRELLTHRRLTGSNDQLPLIVDCERGMGRPQRGLEAVVGVDRKSLDVGVRINLAIALSGARLDMGQPEAALLELQTAELSEKRVYPQSPLMFRAYAECLRELGRDPEEALRWEKLADAADAAMSEPDGEMFPLIEEISIPTSEEFDRGMKRAGERTPWKPRTDGDRRPPRADCDRKPRTDGDRRPPRADGDRRPPRAGDDRKPRTDGDRRPPRAGDDRKPRTDGDRKPRAAGDDRKPRPAGERGGKPRPGGSAPRGGGRPSTDRRREGGSGPRQRGGRG
jgi:hypothetical protein